MNPDEFTLRELLIMAEGRGRFEWGMTSSLMALVANALCGRGKGKAAAPEEFNPYCQKKANIIVTVEQLKRLFPDPGKLA